MRMLAGQIALETKFFFRRKDELFWNLAFPLFFMVLYGFIYGNTMWDEFNSSPPHLLDIVSWIN